MEPGDIFVWRALDYSEINDTDLLWCDVTSKHVRANEMHMYISAHEQMTKHGKCHVAMYLSRSAVVWYCAELKQECYSPVTGRLFSIRAETLKIGEECDE